MSKTLISFLACIGLTIGLAGCNGESTKTDTSAEKEGDLKATTVPDGETAKSDDGNPGEGYVKVTTLDGGMSLYIPEGWKDLKSDDPVVTAGLEEAQKDNPSIAGLVASAKSNDQFKLFVMDFSKEGLEDKFADNINIILQENVPESVQKDWENEVKKGAEQSAKMLNPDGGMKSEVIELPAGKAGTYYGPMVLGGNHSNDTLSYMLLNGDKLYIVTMSCAKDNLTKVKPDLEKIAKSIRFTS